MSWSKMLVLVLALCAFVIGPFVIWGDQMDAQAPQLVQDQPTKVLIALIGVVLLTSDVLLPIPSSVVSISLCLLLGPGLGGLAVFAGMLAAFSAGFVVGRMLPAARLRNWVGPQTWDAFASNRLHASLLWIAGTRPVPVLAEVTAICAGSLGIPFLPCMAAAAASSLFVSITYSLVGWFGLHSGSSSTALLVVVAASLPAASWGAYRWVRRSLAAR